MDFKMKVGKGEMYVAFKFFNKKGQQVESQINRACHGASYTLEESKQRAGEGGYFVGYFNKNECPYDLEEVKWWVEFLNGAGFKGELIETEQDYEIKLMVDDYENTMHFFGAITAYRSFAYIHDVTIPLLLEGSYKLKQKFPEEDNFLLFIFAHFYMKTAYPDHHHTFLSSPTKLFGKDIFLERCKTFDTLNTICGIYAGNNHNYYAQLMKDEKNWESLLKTLKL